MNYFYKRPLKKYKGGKAAREQFRDQQLNDSIMHLMRNGWGINAISGALGNALHESADWRKKFRGDLDPNITEGNYSGLFMNLPNGRQAIIDATGGYSLEDQLTAADLFANGQLPRNIFVGSGRFNKRGYASPTEAAAAWEKHYERSGGQGMQDRLQKAQEVRDYILANKDTYGRMINPMVNVQKIRPISPWNSISTQQIAGINPDGTIRTYDSATNKWSSAEMELPELVVTPNMAPANIRKPELNLTSWSK